MYKGYKSTGDILLMKDLMEKIIPYISLNSCKMVTKINDGNKLQYNSFLDSPWINVHGIVYRFKFPTGIATAYITLS